ncbi:MAG: PepSY-associated TM helix domain-containing protein, partial [Gemmatimonadaceae bacterium]
ARPTLVSFPAKDDQPLAVGMRFPEDRTPGGRSRVYVDAHRGVVLRADGTRGLPAGRTLGNMMRSLHTGDVYGKPTEAVWLLASLIMATQVVTGAMMWWNGRPARAALARKGA